MGAMRVAMFHSRSLLAAGVQSLLQEVAGLELSIVAADDPESGGRLRKLAPNVIVLDSGDASLGGGVIARILEEHPRARVVALSLDHAGIDVYRMRRVQRTNLDGLLEAIQGKRKRARKKAAGDSEGRQPEARR